MKVLSHRAAVVSCVLTLVAATAYAEVGWPSGSQDYEGMTLGDDVDSLGWEVVNTSAPATNFTIKASDQVGGMSTTHGASTRWLKIIDIDGGAVQNRFYSPPVTATAVQRYEWVYYVNLETTPPGGASVKPKLTIQHFDNNAGSFGNVWGIEFTDTGANLIVLGNGGTAASTQLYTLTGPTAVGEWVKISLTVNFDTDMVHAQVNDGTSVGLPINLAANADPLTFRLCYRGEGSGNVMTMLLDDVSVGVIPGIPAVGEWGVAIMALLVLSAGTVLLLNNRRRIRA